MTIAMLFATHHLRADNDLHGLSSIFFLLFSYDDYIGMVWTLLIFVGALFAFQYLGAQRIIRWTAGHPSAIAMITAPLLALGALTVYHNHPLAMDEYAAYFQSRVFGAGALHGRFPVPLLDWLIPPGFQGMFFNVSRATGSVAETYWPGFALLLTPFTWGGVPWLCNPIVSAFTLLVVHRLALEMFEDTEAAAFALLMTIASPVIFANGISYYAMPAHLLANSVFALLLVRPTPLRAAAAGVAGSIALALHNPVPHMLFASPWLIWIATRRGGLRLFSLLIAGYLPLCTALGLGWFVFSGHLLHDGSMSASAPVSSAHQLQDMLKVFRLPNATVVLARLIGIAKTWVWATPGLMILAVVGAVRWRHDVLCRLMSASALLTIIGFFLVPVDQGHGWGYRYFHSAWMTLPLLATAALFRPAGTRSELPSVPLLFEDRATRDFVAACCFLSLILGVGLRAWQMQDFIARDLTQVPQYAGNERRVVIIDGRFSFYGADLVQNDPWLRGSEIRMYTRGPVRDRQMMTQYYPDYHVVHSDKYGTVWTPAPESPESSGASRE